MEICVFVTITCGFLRAEFHRESRQTFYRNNISFSNKLGGHTRTTVKRPRSSIECNRAYRLPNRIDRLCHVCNTQILDCTALS